MKNGTGLSGSGLRLVLMLCAMCVSMMGCELDSFINPSKTGYFEHMPTTIPVLERIDVIEQEDDLWGQTTAVTSEDLIPSDLSYKLTAGDVITVQIFELYTQGQWHVSTRRIDAGGFFRLPEIGEVQAAGMTTQEFEDRVTRLLDEHVIQDPLVDVVVEDGGGFTYTLFGSVRAPGMYALRSPDLRLLDALAVAGGVPQTIDTIFIIREIPLTEELLPGYERDDAQPQTEPAAPPVNIEDLIKELDSGGDDGQPQPGVLRSPHEPIIDVDEPAPPKRETGRQSGDIEWWGPPQQDRRLYAANYQEVDVDQLEQPVPPMPRGAGSDDTFIFDEQKGEWVRIRTDAEVDKDPAKAGKAAPMSVERVIEIPYQMLKRGDSSFNVVIRPMDRVYVEEPTTGVVYLEGEVLRPGVYTLPFNSKLTLSRLIAAAGGLGPLAIPQRCDLIRVVGKSREAAVRVDLAAIRKRTEPDMYLKPDDHVIVGTNFWATPLAIIRSGFRATYGFGFLLDRNFGNDVFGPPPFSGGF